MLHDEIPHAEFSSKLADYCEEVLPDIPRHEYTISFMVQQPMRKYVIIIKSTDGLSMELIVSDENLRAGRYVFQDRFSQYQTSARIDVPIAEIPRVFARQCGHRREIDALRSEIEELKQKLASL